MFIFLIIQIKQGYQTIFLIEYNYFQKIAIHVPPPQKDFFLQDFPTPLEIPIIYYHSYVWIVDQV